jgi:hypothetical protein
MRDLENHDVTDVDDLYGTGDGRVPVDVRAVLTVEGPAWARRHRRNIAAVRQIASISGVVLAVLAWAAVAVIAGLILTGRAALLAPTEGSVGHRPVHLVLVTTAILVIGFITADVMSLGRRNAAAARVGAARSRARAHDHARERESRRDTIRRSFVDGMQLPDNPDLTEDPNGFTGVGTEAPGVSDPGIYSAP